MGIGLDLKAKAEEERKRAEEVRNAPPMMVDPNLEDLKSIEVELALAERLSKQWNCKFIKLPTAAYGVEWSTVDPKTGELRAFVHFVHGKPDDDGCEVRMSRLLRGLQTAMYGQVPFVVVVMRGARSGHYTPDPNEGVSPYGGMHGDQPDLLVKIDESKIKLFKKD